jgi:NAD(P)-dependent dehydrogenase (short-subunit alcohol dehydrogenase family)
MGGEAVRCDVAVEAEIRALVDGALARHGRIDLFCGNAGILTLGGVETPDAQWRQSLDVNVMAHVYALRALLPDWTARHAGYYLATASAAGLLSNPGALPYAVTKHAVVALCEWAAFTHGDAGLKVSCLCPLGVRTEMMKHTGALGDVLLGAGAMEPEAVAEAAVAGLAAEKFLILPHPEVAEMMARRGSEHERWIRGMRKLQRMLEAVLAEQGASPTGQKTT